MALPDTIDTDALVTAVLKGVGVTPYKSAGGAFYCALLDDTTNYRPTVFKSSSPGGGAWTEQDASNRPTNHATTKSNLLMGSVTTADDLLIFCTVPTTLDTTSIVVHFHTFDMSSDTWGTTNEVVSDMSSSMDKPSDSAVGAYYVPIRRGVSGDEDCVFGYGLTTTDMGTTYYHVDMWHKDKTATSWTGPVALQGTMSEGTHLRSFALHTSSNHIFLNCIDRPGVTGASTDDQRQYTVDDTNTVTERAVQTLDYRTRQPHQGFITNYSSTEYFSTILSASVDDDVRTHYSGLTSDIVDATITEIVGSLGAGNEYCVAAAWDQSTETFWYVVVDTDDATIEIWNSTDLGDTTTQQDSSFGTGGSTLPSHYGCNIYTNGSGDTVLGVIYPDTSNDFTYDEYVISAVGGGRAQINPIRGPFYMRSPV